MNYIKLPYRYERVENYVAARQHIQGKIKTLKLMKQALSERKITKKSIVLNQPKLETPVKDMFQDDLNHLNSI